MLRCPVSGYALRLQVISTASKNFVGGAHEIVEQGILFAEKDWFYPIINGIPRLLVESFLDYAGFLSEHLNDYAERKSLLEKKYADLIKYAVRKNKRTKESFAFEWSKFNYEKDKTWNADRIQMFDRFLKETDETADNLKDKIILDAGCGNGLLDLLIAPHCSQIVAMDLTTGIEKAAVKNEFKNLFFVQGDVQFPPLPKLHFDIVQCSGILMHTDNTKSSFSVIEQYVKNRGKLSVWLYHPRKSLIHNFLNRFRKCTTVLPLKLQYYFLLVTIFPVSFVVKKIKGRKQNSREMMVDILDGFTPEFRCEHTHEETVDWFVEKNYHNIKITTNELFGFNITGVKSMEI